MIQLKIINYFDHSQIFGQHPRNIRETVSMNDI